MDNTPNESKYYAPDSLRNAIRLLWSQYSMWTRFYMVSYAANLQDLEYVKDRLLEIPRDFSNIIKIYYGDTIAAEFEILFKLHLNLMIELIHLYINSYSVSQKNGTKQLEKELYENADQISVFLSGINPHWDKDILQNVLYNHIDMLKDNLEKRVNRDYAADVYLYDFIEYHSLMIADIITNGLLKQYYPKLSSL